jgi:hypothetical protein
MTRKTPPTDIDRLRQKLKDLGLWGLLAHFEEIATARWLPRVIALEEAERTKRSLQRRLKNARLGSFKPMARRSMGCLRSGSCQRAPTSC